MPESAPQKKHDHRIEDRRREHLAPRLAGNRLSGPNLLHADRDEVRRTAAASESPRHDHCAEHAPEHHEGVHDAYSLNELLGNGRHEHGAHAVGRRHDAARHAAAIGKVADGRRNACAVRQAEPEAEAAAVRQRDGTRRSRHAAENKSEADEEAAAHDHRARAEAVVDRAAENHRDRTDGIGHAEGDRKIARRYDRAELGREVCGGRRRQHAPGVDGARAKINETDDCKNQPAASGERFVSCIHGVHIVHQIWASFSSRRPAVLAASFCLKCTQADSLARWSSACSV